MLFTGTISIEGSVNNYNQEGEQPFGFNIRFSLIKQTNRFAAEKVLKWDAAFTNQ